MISFFSELSQQRLCITGASTAMQPGSLTSTHLLKELQVKVAILRGYSLNSLKGAILVII